MPILPKETDLLLGDFIRENGLVDKKTYQEEAAAAKSARIGVVARLLEQRKVTEDAIANKLASLYNVRLAGVQGEVDRSLTETLPEEFIRQNRILPLKLQQGSLTVAIADPNALSSVNDVRMMTGYSVETLVMTLSDLEKSMEMFLHVPVQATVPMPPPPPAGDRIRPAKSRGADADEPVRSTKGAESGSEVIDFVNGVMSEAVMLGVSDIHLEAFRDSARVRFRLHGVLQEMEIYNEFLTYNYSAVATRIKIMASLDISERRLPQDGAITCDVGDKTIDIRVSSLPTVYGERIVMRILDPAAANFKLDELGLTPNDLANFRKAIHSPQGMVLVTGPTGSGKSTSLYAVLKELNQVGTNILTAEDPVEYDFSGIGQVQVRENIGLTFSAALRSFLRQDPEVIMVGEIRDKETSDIAMKAALTGHLVLSTLHTNDAPGTIMRLINMGIPAYLISSALNLIVAQRLARVICKQCKEVDESYTRDRLLMIGFSEEEAKTLVTYRGKGCDVCMDTGVRGRRAIHEILPVTPLLKEAILGGKSEAEMKEIAMKQGFRPMQETGRQLIRDGIITVAEFQRILMME